MLFLKVIVVCAVTDLLFVEEFKWRIVCQDSFVPLVMSLSVFRPFFRVDRVENNVVDALEYIQHIAPPHQRKGESAHPVWRIMEPVQRIPCARWRK